MCTNKGRHIDRDNRQKERESRKEKHITDSFTSLCAGDFRGPTSPGCRTRKGERERETGEGKGAQGDERKTVGERKGAQGEERKGDPDERNGGNERQMG